MNGVYRVFEPHFLYVFGQPFYFSGEKGISGQMPLRIIPGDNPHRKWPDNCPLDKSATSVIIYSVKYLISIDINSGAIVAILVPGVITQG